MNLDIINQNKKMVLLGAIFHQEYCCEYFFSKSYTHFACRRFVLGTQKLVQLLLLEIYSNIL